MPIKQYTCDNEDCKFTKDYIESTSVSKSMWHPENCPECKTGKMEYEFCATGISHDIVGYCYENEYGKKNWKKNLSAEQQRDVLLNKRNPY